MEFFLSGPNAPSDEGPDRDISEALGDGEQVEQVDISQLVPNPHQPRREFSAEDLADLARSIQSAGILQPILARRVGDNLQIIAGERRWRAARQAGLGQVPTIVKQITDEQAAVFGLVENLHRADLNPMEKAKAFRQIQTLTKGTQEELARQVGLERSSVANFLRLLDSPEQVQALVARGQLTMGHARALLGLADEDEQVQVAQEIVRSKLSVRQVEALVQDTRKGSGGGESAATARPGKGKQPARPLWLKEIEDNLEEALDAQVSVKYGRKRSRIIIECSGREDFERVYNQLRGGGN